MNNVAQSAGKDSPVDITRAAIDLAYAIRSALAPHLGRQSAKQSTGKTSSGDESFAIDEVAEQVIEEFIRERRLPVAYYTEGCGLVETRGAEHLLVIDPIDGSRPAMHGFEACVVSIAVAPNLPDARMSDVTFGLILELKTDRLFTAHRDGPVRIQAGSTDVPVTLTSTTNLDSCSWSFEVAGRPMAPTAQVLSSLVDESSLRGGVFVFSSTAFSLTRLVSGQLDAVVDVGNRIFRDYPGLRGEFLQAGLGTVMGLFPYDIAAAVLIAERAGCTVTDAYGNSLDRTFLLDTSEQNIRSCLAASSAMLHTKLLSEIEKGMREISPAA